MELIMQNFILLTDLLRELRRNPRLFFFLQILHTRKEKLQNMNEICGDDRFVLIERAKKHLLESTNIETSPDDKNKT